jgi:shikimate kinase
VPLIFVTGISTSGKSTIARELTRRGYEAYDTEHNGISAWYNKATGERAAEFGQVPERTKEWMDQHEWRISIDWVKQVTEKAKGKPIFLCGGGANESEVRALCSKAIWLKTDEKTIRERVNIPRDHTYGTKPHELVRAIEGNLQKEAEYQKLGVIMIDARRPLAVVVDEMVKRLGREAHERN